MVEWVEWVDEFIPYHREANGTLGPVSQSPSPRYWNRSPKIRPKPHGVPGTKNGLGFFSHTIHVWYIYLDLVDFLW